MIVCIVMPKSMAIRRKQITANQWPLERIRQHDVKKRHKKYGGQVMFPSSHDITPTNLDACLTVLKKLLDAGNQGSCGEQTAFGMH